MYTTKINSAATNNAQRIRQTATSLWRVEAFNAGGAAAFVKIYDKGVSAPVVGTDVPVMVLAVPAASTASLALNAKAALQLINGLGIGIVTGAADTDNTAVAAAQVKVTLGFGG